MYNTKPTFIVIKSQLPLIYKISTKSHGIDSLQADFIASILRLVFIIYQTSTNKRKLLLV